MDLCEFDNSLVWSKRASSRTASKATGKAYLEKNWGTENKIQKLKTRNKNSLATWCVRLYLYFPTKVIETAQT